VKIKLIGLNARFSHSCLALFYLRNELEEHLPDVVTEICQYTINDPYYTLLQRIAEGESDYLFFSASIWNSDLVQRLIEDLFCIDSARRIVIGGPQAEIVGETFTDEPGVTLFLGPVEAADEKFYDDLHKNQPEKNYRVMTAGARNRLFNYPYRPVDFDYHLRNRAVYYESSRGCPFSCTYCLSSAESGLYHKDLDQVFSELDDMLQHQPETIRFVDRTFNDVPQRALAIWRYLRDKDPPTLFHFEIAPDRFSTEMLDFLRTARAGLFQFEIGVQSTNGETLRAIRRTIDPAAAGEVIRQLRSMENIHLHADLILGLPFETAATFKNSINDLFSMQPHYMQMGLLKLLPDTAIHSQADSWDYRYGRRPPYAVLANRWMTADTLRGLYWLGECIERCCNNRYFPTLWRYLVDSGEDMADFFQSLACRFHAQGYFWRAVTQKTLTGMLIEEVAGRDDFQLVRELICFDWLRCGHRFLPEPLTFQEQPIDELRRQLYHQLPREFDGLYRADQRKTWIKTSVFHWFSGAALGYAGFSSASEPTLVCFLNQREQSVYRLNKAVLVQISN
jgi:radical SAM superfamily enzyme YgiQ (UPF0313 family)